MLVKTKIISSKEGKKINDGLSQILKDIQKGKIKFDSRFEDIHIPTDIASEITCQYFGYLQRNLSNNLKVATTLLDRDITATDTKKQWRVRNFDLGANKPQLQVNYLKSIFR